MPYKDADKRKEYAANHYESKKADYQEARKRSRQVKLEYVNSIKENNPCTDCGMKYHYCQMQFDHIGDDKVEAVSRLIRSGTLVSIKLEIAKCELVCANCHALRTYGRIMANKENHDAVC